MYMCTYTLAHPHRRLGVCQIQDMVLHQIDNLGDEVRFAAGPGLDELEGVLGLEGDACWCRCRCGVCWWVGGWVVGGWVDG